MRLNSGVGWHAKSVQFKRCVQGTLVIYNRADDGINLTLLPLLSIIHLIPLFTYITPK